MPRGVRPSIVDSNRRKVVLLGSGRFLEGGEEPIQVSKELDELA
jgi:hypothetical protein